MNVTAPLPDARVGNWVDQWAAVRLRPWLKLGRLDRPAGAWLLLLPGWQGVALACAMSRRGPQPLLLGLIFVGALVMRAAGCAFNDLVDRDIDAKVARTAARPLASGQIGVRGAVAFLVGCSLVGLAVLLTMNASAIWLGVLSLALVAAYPFMKRITWWPQAWLGLTFNWGALLGFAAVQGRLSWSAFLLYLGGVFWTLGYDTIYAIQDLEDDALAGVKSSARRLGRGVGRGVAVFYATTAFLTLASVITAGLGPLSYAGLALYVLHLGWQARGVRVDDAGSALRLFKSNRDAGALLFVALAVGAWRP